MTKKVIPLPKPAHPRFFFREWRKHRGYNQEDLAALVGVTPSTISQLETGKQGFTDSTLTALSEALACSPGDLLMRNPLDQDAPWSLWDTVKKMPSAQRAAIVAVVETMLKTGT
jgi:transcriptional regulator with XRE-family HTH domain